MTSNREIQRRTQDQLVTELVARFGPKPSNWAFQCPSCGDIATGGDFRAALDGAGLPDVYASARLGQECIGRTLGALRRGVEYKGRGCDWCAYGLFRGPDFVVLPDGREAPSFPIAPGPRNDA